MYAYSQVPNKGKEPNLRNVQKGLEDCPYMPPGGEWEKGKEAKWGKAEKRPSLQRLLVALGPAFWTYPLISGVGSSPMVFAKNCQL